MIEKDDTAAGFLSDAQFREWVLHPNAANTFYWENYLKAHPGEVEEITWARQIIAGLQQRQHRLAEEKVNSLWEAIEAEMENPGQPVPAPATAPRFKGPLWKLALLTLGLGGLLFGSCRRPGA